MLRFKSFEEFFLLTMVCVDILPLLNPSIVSFTSKFLGSREQQLPPIVMQLFIENIKLVFLEANNLPFYLFCKKNNNAYFFDKIM